MMQRYTFRCERCDDTVKAISRPKCCSEPMALVGKVERDDEQTRPMALGKVMCRQCDMAEVTPGEHCKWCTTLCPTDIQPVAALSQHEQEVQRFEKWADELANSRWRRFIDAGGYAAVDKLQRDDDWRDVTGEPVSDFLMRPVGNGAAAAVEDAVRALEVTRRDCTVTTRRLPDCMATEIQVWNMTNGAYCRQIVSEDA